MFVLLFTRLALPGIVCYTFLVYCRAVICWWVICLAPLGVIFLLRKSDIAPVGRSDILFACILQTRVAHITSEGHITHEVHITRRRRIELAHLLYRRRAAWSFPLRRILFSKNEYMIEIEQDIWYNIATIEV